jgi:hypothetical protein
VCPCVRVCVEGIDSTGKSIVTTATVTVSMRITRNWAELSTGDPVPREIADDIVWPFSQPPLEPSENQKMERVVCEEGTADCLCGHCSKTIVSIFWRRQIAYPLPQKCWRHHHPLFRYYFPVFKLLLDLLLSVLIIRSLRIKCQSHSI